MGGLFCLLVCLMLLALLCMWWTMHWSPFIGKFVVVYFWWYSCLFGPHFIRCFLRFYGDVSTLRIAAFRPKRCYFWAMFFFFSFLAECIRFYKEKMEAICCAQDAKIRLRSMIKKEATCTRRSNHTR